MLKAFLNYTAQEFATSEINKSPLPRLIFKEGDTFTFSLVLLEEANETPSVPFTVLEDIPSPYVQVKLAGRAEDDLESASPIFTISSFVKVGTGDDTLFQGDFFLNDSALTTALSGEKFLDCLVDVQFDDGVEGGEKYTFVKSWACRVYRDILRDTDPVDSEALSAVDRLNRSLTYREVPDGVTFTIPDKYVWIVHDPIIDGDVVLEGDGAVYLI